MKVAITGGAGFIGSEMVRSLIRLGIKVHVIDSLTYAGNLESIREFKDHIVFHETDIRDKDSLSIIFIENEFDTVVNFAAETHVDNSINSPEIFLETNILGVFNLLELARKYGFRFLQVSTDEVYGSIQKGEFSEDDKLNPSSPYSASKASAELLIQSYIKTFSVNALGVRCSNNYGQYQHYEKLIPSFISKIKRGYNLPVYGDGSNIREWIHVSDSVSGIIQVLEKGRIGEFYNVSSGEFKTNLEVTKSILEYFNAGIDRIDFVVDRLGHDFRYAINSSKIRSELGWYPKVKFEQGLKETIEWYLDNPSFMSGNSNE